MIAQKNRPETIMVCTQSALNEGAKIHAAFCVRERTADGIVKNTVSTKARCGCVVIKSHPYQRFLSIAKLRENKGKLCLDCMWRAGVK